MRILIGPNGFGLEQVIPELSARHPDVTFAYCDDHARLIDEIGNAEVYFGWLSNETLAAATQLRWVQSPSTGVDGFLKLPALRDSEIILTSARGTHAACLAEHALAMIFAFTRGIKAFSHHQRERRWEARALRNTLVELTGSTLGIVGFGTVGQALAKRAQAFDMRIRAVDVLPREKPDYVEQLDGLDALDELLAVSDYVVITAPYTPETRGMIGTAQLARMKPNAILIGISRGGVIDEAALISALNAGQIAAAAMDVFEQEPLSADSPLWDMDNVLITPHAAGGSQFESATIRGIFVENVDRYLRGEFPLRNQIDKQLGF
jgi:phosphoglycerate dehydrogenase-like enzyme